MRDRYGKLCNPLTQDEKGWLWKALPLLLLRRGERERDLATTLPKITMADLPLLP
jgi:hypothetical protein